MKVSTNPYGGSYPLKVPPETITGQMNLASGKAKARFPSPPMVSVQTNSVSGKMQKGGRALTPGTTPTGS